MAIELRALGTLDLRDGTDGRRLGSVLAQPKRVGLLVYLAIAPPRGFRQRQTLLGLFWPDSPEPNARRALNQALYVLRRGVGPGVIVSRGEDEVGVDPDRLWCDVTTFRDCLEAGDRPRALELYRGDLLDGFYVDGADNFERWLERERADLGRAAIRAASELAAEEEGRGRTAEAIRWARRATRIASFDERCHRRLLCLLDRAGERSGALHEHERFRRRLRTELSIEPGSETVELVEAILSRGVEPEAAPAEAGVARSASDPEPTVEGASTGESGATAPGPSPALAPDRPRPHWSRVRVAAGILVPLAGLATALAFAAGRPGADSDPDPQRVLVLPLVNETGDPTLDAVGKMAADWIVQGLVAPGLVDVIVPPLSRDAETIFEGLDVGEAIESAASRGAGTVVRGSYYAQQDSLAFHVEVIRAADGVVLGAVAAFSESRTAPLEALSPLRERVAGVLGIRSDSGLASVASRSGPPPRYDAYEEYVIGKRRDEESDFSGAVERYLRAAKLDTSFLVPILDAVEILTQYPMPLQGFPPADSLIGVLSTRRTRLSQAGGHELDALRARAEADAEARFRAYRRAFEISPSRYGSEYVDAALDVGRYEVALETLERLEPQRQLVRAYWQNRIIALHLLGRFEDEYEAGLRAEAEGRSDTHRMRVPALAALGRMGELERIFIEAGTEPRGSLHSGGMKLVAANELHRHGRTEIAEQLAVRAAADMERYQAADTTRFPALPNYPRALIIAGQLDEAERDYRRMSELFLGDPEYRRAAARAGRDSLAPPEWIGAGLATIAARRGEDARARRLARDHMTRARVEALLGDHDAAVRQLQEALARGTPRWALHYEFGVDLVSLSGHPAFEVLMLPEKLPPPR